MAKETIQIRLEPFDLEWLDIEETARKEGWRPAFNLLEQWARLKGWQEVSMDFIKNAGFVFRAFIKVLKVRVLILPVPYKGLCIPIDTTNNSTFILRVLFRFCMKQLASAHGMTMKKVIESIIQERMRIISKEA